MPAASNAQVQQFVDVQIRPFCQQMANLAVSAASIKAQIGDVYTALTEGSPTWTDANQSNLPHAMTPADVLSINAIITAFLYTINTSSTDASVQAINGQWSVLQESCPAPIT